MPDKASTLLSLGNVLARMMPPSVLHIAEFIQGSKEYPDFVRLIREFLPEFETEILVRPTMREQIAEFGERFAGQYFPLSGYITEECAESYGDLLWCIPLEVGGVDSYTYHEMPSEGRTGHILMSALVEAPSWEEDARIPILEKCADFVSKALLKKIPEKGFPIDELEQKLIGTPYEAVCLWSRMIDHSTDCFFLDTDEEELSMSFGHGYSNVPQWDMATVNILTKDWHRGEEIWGEINLLTAKIEADPKKMMWEIINLMVEDMYPVHKPQKETLFEMFAEESEGKEVVDGEIRLL